MWYLYTYTNIILQTNSPYEKLEFCFYCSEYSLEPRNLAGQTIKIRYNKPPIQGTGKDSLPGHLSQWCRKSPSQLLHSLIWPFPPPERFLWLSVALKPKINILKIWFSIYYYSKPHYLISLISSSSQIESYAWPTPPLLSHQALFASNKHLRGPLQQDSFKKMVLSSPV